MFDVLTAKYILQFCRKGPTVMPRLEKIQMTGWPDEFVQKLAQNVAQPILVKISTRLLPWKKAAQTIGLLL
jgi:hypothetical protein